MITHKAMEARLRGFLMRVALLRETKKNEQALAVLDDALGEILAHKRASALYPPDLLILECEVYRNAYQLIQAGVK